LRRTARSPHTRLQLAGSPAKVPEFEVGFGPASSCCRGELERADAASPSASPALTSAGRVLIHKRCRRRSVPRSKVVVVSVGIGKVISEDLQWRAASADYLETVDRIGNEIHVHLQERAEVFAEKFNLFGEGCFVLVQKERVVGYGLSHPWDLNSIPPLDTFLHALPSTPECLFIHDIVVLPEARHHAAAGALVELVAAVARQRGIAFLALVSVYDTHPLWARHGFEIVSNRSLDEKLKSYGDPAKYMVRRSVRHRPATRA
jgi:GNAT superfamily N-acetyltransferase